MASRCADGDARDASLETWARERGVRWCASVEVRGQPSSDGSTAHRGVYARMDGEGVSRDEAINLVTIPREAMIACERDEGKRPVVGGVSDEAAARDELALELLRRKFDAERNFGPYIDSLPESYALLHSWSDAEARELQDSTAMALARRRRLELEKAFERVKTEVIEITHCESEDDAYAQYRWACGTVSSRAVSVPFHDAGALCPVGDMFNYAPLDPPSLIRVVGAPTFGVRAEDDDDDEAGTTVGAVERDPIPGDGAYDEATRTFSFRSSVQPAGRRGCLPGEEIFVCYGEYSNLELLDFYGFVLEPDVNPQDCYTLDVCVDDSTSMMPLKVFVGGFDWNDLAEIRIRSALAKTRKNEKHLRDIARQGGALGGEEELSVFDAIRKAAGETLLSFPTTAKQDVDALADSRVSMSEKIRLATTWRLGIKRIVQRAYKWADARCAEVQSIEHGMGRLKLAHVARPK